MLFGFDLRAWTRLGLSSLVFCHILPSGQCGRKGSFQGLWRGLPRLWRLPRVPSPRSRGRAGACMCPSVAPSVAQGKKRTWMPPRGLSEPRLAFLSTQRFRLFFCRSLALLCVRSISFGSFLPTLQCFRPSLHFANCCWTELLCESRTPKKKSLQAI